jgi:hypothetical protein
MDIKLTGPGGRLVFTPPDLVKQLEDLPINLRKRAIRKGLLQLGKRQKQIVSTGLRSGTFAIASLAPSTILARQIGKKAGITPARPTSKSTYPLHYTGETARGITVSIVNDALVVVGPSFEPISYSGTAAIRAATYQELGFRQRGKFTRKSLAYLHILFRKDDERGARAREDSARGSKKNGARVGTGYTRNVPARPVWDLARRQVAGEAPAIMREHVRMALVAAGLMA